VPICFSTLAHSDLLPVSYAFLGGGTSFARFFTDIAASSLDRQLMEMMGWH
jgi:hypothetical protein